MNGAANSVAVCRYVMKSKFGLKAHNPHKEPLQFQKQKYKPKIEIYQETHSEVGALLEELTRISKQKLFASRSSFSGLIRVTCNGHKAQRMVVVTTIQSAEAEQVSQRANWRAGIRCRIASNL